jgi:hypothetical protein
MEKRKEGLLHLYLEVTQQALSALKNDQFDQIEELLNKREDIIAEINRIDQSYGSIVINETIKTVIERTIPLENELMQHLHIKKEEAQAKLKSIRKGKQLKHQYQRISPYTDGIFYDKRK